MTREQLKAKYGRLWRALDGDSLIWIDGYTGAMIDARLYVRYRIEALVNDAKGTHELRRETREQYRADLDHELDMLQDREQRAAGPT